MTTHHLLSMLTRQGVSVALRDGQLVARPAAKVTEELATMIRRQLESPDVVKNWIKYAEAVS
jgi:hypothetical protein